MMNKQRKLLYPTLFILGVILMAWQISIFRNTIIDLSFLIGIVFVIAIIAFLLDFKNFEKTHNYSGIGLYFYASMYYICGFGFIVCSIFILTNYYMADSESVKETYEIVERSSTPGRRHYREERKPTFDINYKGKIKELVFPHKYYDKMNFYTKVELEVRKGYFGYDILENKKLN